MSDTQSPQGFLSVIKTLDKTNEFDTIKGDSKYLALDNVQDPSNLGTVLRSAEAFNVSGVILSCDCCDIYNPKVVRGSMGAVFRIPFIIKSSIKDFLNENPQINSYAAVVNSDAVSLTDVKFQTPCAIVVGNEGNGIKAETEKKPAKNQNHHTYGGQGRITQRICGCCNTDVGNDEMISENARYWIWISKSTRL